MADDKQIEVPPFNHNGLLPPARYRATETQFESRFVDSCQSSNTRRPLFRSFRQWRSDSENARVSEAVQWIDGSFVQDKENPNDIDVVTFVHYDSLNALPVVAQNFIDQWMSKGRAQDKYGVDSYFHACCGPGHEFYPVWKEKKKTYEKLFGFTKNGGLPKGFIEMLFGEVGNSLREAFEDES